MSKVFVKGKCILLPVSLRPSLFSDLLTLYRYSDIAGEGIAAKLKSEIVRRHSGHQQAPESHVESLYKTT